MLNSYSKSFHVTNCGLVKGGAICFVVTLLGLWSSTSSAYEVWMGTHLMESTVATSLDDWDLTASMLDGVNINRAPDDTNPASNSDWQIILAQFDDVSNTITEFPRSRVSRNPALVDELAFNAMEDALQQTFNVAGNFNYDIGYLLVYNNATTYQGSQYNYDWTDIEVQHMRDWLDSNGHQDVELVWNARNFSPLNRDRSENPLIDHVMIEASADSLLNNTNNQITLLNWLWTNPATINKKVILQIPRSNNSMTQYASTRRVAVQVGQELGYDANGIQSDRLVFLPVTYNDNYAYLPETTSEGTSYTNSLTSLALSLLEQRPLFEGLTGTPTNADADSFVRSTVQQSFGTLLAGWDTWENATTPNASFTASGITGSAVTTSEQIAWHVIDGRGASADGDWGTFSGPATASTVAGDGVTNENLELPNATTGGTITFTITNTGTDDIDLDGFHFDAYAFRPKAARAYELSVAAGDITNGVIYTSSDDEITEVGGTWNNNAHDDISHSLVGLADHTLEAGGTVSFLLAFSSGVGDGSGGHDLWLDNVGVTGTVALVSQAPDGSLRYHMGTGVVDGQDIGFVLNSEELNVGQTGTAPFDRAAVMVFQLPNLGAIEDPFQAASFQTYLTQTVTSENVGGDLYGIARRDAPDILNSDYYGRTNTPDPSAVLLEDDFLVEDMATSAPALTSSTGSENLRDFLNEQYAGGEGIGDYVFLRLNVDAETSQRWNIASGDASVEDQKPQILYQAIGGPQFLLGDFDNDGNVDLDDLDQYIGNIEADAVGDLVALDLNNDGTVGADDFAQHYQTLVETSNGKKGTFAGDLDLNGTVDVLGDAFALINNLGTNSATSWALGDIDANGIVDVLGDAFELINNLGNTNE